MNFRKRFFSRFFAAALLCLSQIATSAETSFPYSPIPPLRSGSGLESFGAGRDLLKYIVRCAMPDGAKISVPHDGQADVLDGWMGLAPEWKHAPLSPPSARWVSACELAFVNALGVHVLVSLRGDHPNLKTSITSDERKKFTFQEAAFYGNLFREPMIQYVCRGKGGSVPSPSKAQRLCSDPSADPTVSQCNMIITGNCSDVCSVEDATDHFVTHCRGGNEVYDEVVTAFLWADSDVRN